MRGNLQRFSVEEIAASLDHASLELPTPDFGLYPPEAISFATTQYGMNGRRRDDVRVAAGEMLANAILHGNERDVAKQIGVYCLWNGRNFYVAVQDEGPGFDIDAPPFVPGRSGIPPEGGLGLVVLQQKTDLVYTDGPAVVAAFRV